MTVSAPPLQAFSGNDHLSDHARGRHRLTGVNYVRCRSIGRMSSTTPAIDGDMQRKSHYGTRGPTAGYEATTVLKIYFSKNEGSLRNLLTPFRRKRGILELSGRADKGVFPPKAGPC